MHSPHSSWKLKALCLWHGVLVGASFRRETQLRQTEQLNIAYLDLTERLSRIVDAESERKSPRSQGSGKCHFKDAHLCFWGLSIVQKPGSMNYPCNFGLLQAIWSSLQESAKHFFARCVSLGRRLCQRTRPRPCFPCLHKRGLHHGS